ncbi:MAG: hypothetical protein ACLTFB_01080 [Candidatus Phytoplasma pyri]
MLNKIKKLIFIKSFVFIIVTSLIVINYCFNSIKANINTVFHRELNDQIQMFDYPKWQKDWLKTQPKMNIRRFKVLEFADIYKILAFYDHNDLSKYSDNPGYNNYDRKSLNYFYFKNPSLNLLTAFFIPRKPHNEQVREMYLQGGYQYTLDDLLTCEYEISDAFIFELADKIDSNLKINHIKTTIPYNQTKLEFIKNYLKTNLNFDKEINLNCYNSNLKSGIISSLPTNSKYNNDLVDAIYFDDGIRFINSTNHDINDLLKLSNGAKNVYIFSLTNAEKPQINIINHYFTSIQDIKEYMYKNYNVFVVPNTFIRGTSFNPSPFEEKNGKNIAILSSKFLNCVENLYGVYFEFYPNCDLKNIECFNLSDLLQEHNIIKTAHMFYRKEKVQPNPYEVALAQYEIDLQKWKDQCYFKPGNYSGYKIREILGKSNKTLYCCNSWDRIQGIYFTYISPDRYDINRYKIFYKYHPGTWDRFFIDGWHVEKEDGNWCSLGTSDDGIINVKFEGYYDTTEPPYYPDILRF